jgi:Transglycosylase SLT domain
MTGWMKRLAPPVFGWLLGFLSGAASPCEQAAAEAEKAFDLPPGLMAAIGRVESGRYDSTAGRVVPWPWTIDVAGDGRQFDSAIEVVRTTQWLRDKGVTNIDVGCFQISLQYHPDAFATMDAAFDPSTNGHYAGQLLASLKARLGNWPDAVAAYHSADPAKGIPYRDKVYASLQGAPPPPLVVAEEVAPPGPKQLPFGIHLWTPSAPGTAASVIHIGPATPPPPAKTETR